MTLHLTGRSLPPSSLPQESLADRARAGAAIAALHADRVDQDAVFPVEAILALKEARMFSALLPRRFGGEGASIGAVANACYTIAQSCASTAMIYAMHQAALACVSEHAAPGGWHETLLRRVADEQLLFASSTTEGSAGGNVRSSDAALIGDGETVSLSRAATVMSYGAQADAIVSTARRTADSVGTDQVLVVVTKADRQLTAQGSWNTLGMRGTCSNGFDLQAEFAREQVMPVAYAKIHPLTMVPVSHLTWAAVWSGIAAAAVTKAQMFVRTATRKSGGTAPPGAALATRAAASLYTLRGLTATTIANYMACRHDPALVTSLERQAQFNLMKVETSELASSIVLGSMRACGLAGFRNDGPFGIGRHLRDILSAPVMIHNERVLANIGAATLMGGVPDNLFEDMPTEAVPASTS